MECYDTYLEYHEWQGCTFFQNLEIPPPPKKNPIRKEKKTSSGKEIFRGLEPPPHPPERGGGIADAYKCLDENVCGMSWNEC